MTAPGRRYLMHVQFPEVGPAVIVGDHERLHKCRSSHAAAEVEAGDEVEIGSDCRQVYSDA